MTAKRSVLLIHGMSSSQSTRWRVGPELEARGWDVDRVDLAGHGGRPIGAARSVAALAEDVVAQHPVGETLVVGHSLGAIVALELVAAIPTYARGVLLEDPPALGRNRAAGDIDGDIGRGARPVRTVGVTARWGKRDASALPLQVRPLPAEMETGFGASFRVLLVSCFYRNKDASGLAGGVAFRLAHGGRPPDLVLTVGDQVHLDNPPSGAIHLTEGGFAKSFETKYRDNWQTDAVGAGYAEILRVAPVAALNAAACYAVAGLLGTAAALVAGRPNRFDRPRRVAVTGVVGVLASRGMLGLVGRTDLFSPTSTGDRFRRLDRRFYSPLCLTLAALTWLSLPGKKG